MCGICGWFAREGFDGRSATENLEKMCEKIIPRGPDASGIELCGRGGFGHRRLKVIDLTEAGAQPMYSRDGRYLVTFNGEIYNHKEIRKKLERELHVREWRGSSDTETLTEAIAAYGMAQALVYCKGMFAISAYEKETGTLFLARDRIGEKPLYFGFTKDAFVFASDISSIAALPGFDKKIQRSALIPYFTFGYIPAPYTIYEGVWKLAPGTVLEVKAPYARFDPVADDVLPSVSVTRGAKKMREGYSLTHYYSAAGVAFEGMKEPFAGTYNGAVDALEEILKGVVGLEAVADVPLGAFLSGGIDSSVIVSMMQAACGNVKTFTIGFEESDFDESADAAKIAAHLGTKHTKLSVSEKEAKDVIPLLAGIYGEPFADSSQIPTYLVSKLTRGEVTVALTGDGGDELFAGYNSYYSVDRIWNKLRYVPHFLRSGTKGVLDLKPLRGIAGRNSVRSERIKLLDATGPMDVQRIQQCESGDGISGILAALLEKAGGEAPKVTEDIFPEELLDDTIRQMMLLDLYTYHPEDILTKVDRASMAVSLETRVPFLHPDVIKFAWSLPTTYLCREGKGKRILRDLLKRHIPAELFEGKPKKGFSVPVKSWLLEKELKDWAMSMLEPAKLKREGFLPEEEIANMWQGFAESGEWNKRIWYALMFESWLEEAGI